MSDDKPYPRDLVGYGKTPPAVRWPGGARVAVQFVVNYEEGGENCVLHGDAASESFLSEIANAAPFAGRRHLNMESIYEYGARAGFWRLLRVFQSRQLPATAFAVASALERNPAAADAMKNAGWEIAGHGLRWIDYSFMEENEEREHLQRALDIHRRIVGDAPRGWYIGRTSPNTRRLLLELGDWDYDADSYADDLPYWMRGREGRPHLIIPYTLDANDMRFAASPGFVCGEHFFAYLRDAFDALYAEGETHPKMMSVGLHCRLIGRPGRIGALEKFLDHIQSRGGAWICRRIDIARHWRKHHPPDKEQLRRAIGVF